jgi:hypothetical protein
LDLGYRSYGRIDAEPGIGRPARSPPRFGALVWLETSRIRKTRMAALVRHWWRERSMPFTWFPSSRLGTHLEAKLLLCETGKEINLFN